MPIQHHVDYELRLVIARCVGVVTDEDVFGYQQAVWSRTDVIGFHELIDTTPVRRFVVPSPRRVRDLATLSSDMDRGSGRTKLAIIAPGTLSYGLGRMYQTYRELDRRSTKDVGVFRTCEQAWEWLGMERPFPV
jgi:hypothetical protein